MNTLFDMTPECHVCKDVGLWELPNGLIGKCPNIVQHPHGFTHNAPGPAATSIRRAVFSLQAREQPVNSHLFSLAVGLRSFTSKQPCQREYLLETYFRYASAEGRLRHFHKAIEDLRKTWFLPIGSRKDPPSGYWIITELDDFADWVERSKAAPITQLTTIHRVARANFPVFAEQLEFEFWKDLEPTELKSAA
jgi:hypothetical protein